MTPEEFQRLEDLIVKANQSGKKETSDLVHDILHRIEPMIKESIQTNVNGKIDALHVKVDSYIQDDNEWKQKFEPYMEGIVNLSGTGKIMLKVIIWVTAAIGLYALIKDSFVK